MRSLFTIITSASTVFWSLMFVLLHSVLINIIVSLVVVIHIIIWCVLMFLAQHQKTYVYVKLVGPPIVIYYLTYTTRTYLHILVAEIKTTPATIQSYTTWEVLHLKCVNASYPYFQRAIPTQGQHFSVTAIQTGNISGTTQL